ncbi:penicillin-binding protein 2, partial [Spirochaetota bacterium]
MTQSSIRARMLEAFRYRMFFFVTIAGIAFLIIIIQLINLQLIQGKEYKIKSRLNMENYIPIPATRGEVYDRNYRFNKGGNVIVSSRPSFNIVTIPSKFKSERKLKNVVMNLSDLLKIKYKDILQDIKSRNPWERAIIVEDIGFDTVVKIASHPYLFKNIYWEDAPVRVYNFNNMFSHVVGYIGTINKKEYHGLKKHGYKHYQKIGKSGIEKKYDKILRGRDGYVKRIVDVRNRTEGEEIGLRPVSGNNIVLSLDYEVQSTVYKATENLKGAIIVSKPSTGEILALVSKPDYDPNKIISKNNIGIIRELLTNKNKPFINRVIQSKYPPASTFKIITAIAALETESTYPGKRYHCPGKYTLKGYIDKDFYDYRIHGTLDLYDAIAKSCCVYFYHLGYKIGPTSIMRYAGYLGLNKKTLIDLPGETQGFVPSKKWKLRRFGQSWFDGDTINMSIGQGFLNVTPIGMMNFISAIVNNGIVYKPVVVKEIRSPDNVKEVKGFTREKIREIPLSPKTL